MTQRKTTYKILFCILTMFTFLPMFGQGQIQVKKLDPSKLPKEIKYIGKIKDAIGFIDSVGDNIVFTTETGETTSKSAPDDSYRDAALYGYRYILKGDSINLAWKLYDYIKECPLDIEATFIKNTLQVTDLNNDGIAEIWLMYKTVCHGDISPSDMKIIMYQAQQKFAMRGENKVQVAEKEFYGGDFKFDKAFKDGPKEFREFAEKLWRKNIMQTWKE